MIRDGPVVEFGDFNSTKASAGELRRSGTEGGNVTGRAAQSNFWVIPKTTPAPEALGVKLPAIPHLSGQHL